MVIVSVFIPGSLTWISTKMNDLGKIHSFDFLTMASFCFYIYTYTYTYTYIHIYIHTYMYILIFLGGEPSDEIGGWASTLEKMCFCVWDFPNLEQEMLPHNLVNEFEHYLFFIIFDDLKKYIYVYIYIHLLYIF